MRIATRARVAGSVLAIVTALGVAATPAAAATPIVGGGSGFAAPEIDQWKADTAVTPYNLGINYVAEGSSFGRQSFTHNTLDFGASDITYPQVEQGGLQSGRCAGKPLASCFVYVPVSAGGLGIMYNLVDDSGNRVKNLKLTRREACKIFTGAITQWNDPELVATNPPLASFSRVIHPVIRADGAGESYVFSEFCIAVAPDVWHAFIIDRQQHDGANVADDFKAGQPVSNWPQNWGLSNPVPFADGVANAVASPDVGTDAITYDAAAYAVQRSFPMASLQNAAGLYTQPDELNVTVALAYAKGNGDGTFRLNFSGLTAAYFPSTYSYILAQTAGFDPGKGATLARFLCFAVSKGQADAVPLKYARLSSQIVAIAISAIVRIPGAPSAANCPVAGAPPPPPPPTVTPGSGNGTGSNVGGTGTPNGAGNGNPSSGPGGAGTSTPGAGISGPTSASHATRAGKKLVAAAAVSGSAAGSTLPTQDLDAQLAAAAATAAPPHKSTPTIWLLVIGAVVMCAVTELLAPSAEIAVRSRAVRFLSSVGGPVLAGFLALGVISSGGTGALAAKVAAPAPPYVELKGEGAWSPFEEFVPWHNQLAAAKSPIDLGYTATGSFIGRGDLLAGGADFALSGIPFTPSQLKSAKRTAKDFIDAPLVVSTLGFLTMRPITARPGFQSFVVRCDPLGDPATWPSGVTDPFDPVNGCEIWTPYAGAIKIPTENLAAMMFQYQLGENGSPIGEPLSSWNSPGVVQAFGVDNLQSVPPKRGPTPVLRSDQDETNYFLQKFAAQYAPGVWDGLKRVDPKAPWEPITEALPRQASASRGEADQQADLLGIPSDPSNSGPPFGGAIADVPPSAIIAVKSTFPSSNLEYAQLQNANGDWVAPTPAAIDAAVNAGGDTPLYAFANKVPGAYPFVWVDHLYAPAHGLSIAKTEGLATLIRYLATTGQDAAAPVGEGRLPPALTTKALTAADALVTANCTGAGRVIVKNSDPGPVAPDSDALKKIGPMLHCEAAPAPTTTTSASTTTSTTVPLPVDTTPVTPAVVETPPIQEPVTTPVTSPAPASTTPPTVARRVAVTHHGSSALIATRLPLGPPGGPSGVDRLGTFLLGAALYLLLRRPVARTVRRVVV